MLVNGELACDHALSLYLCNLLSGGGRYFFPSRAKEVKKKITPDLRSTENEQRERKIKNDIHTYIHFILLCFEVKVQ